MSTNYTFNTAANAPGAPSGFINTTTLHAELVAAALGSATFQGVTRDGAGNFTIMYDADLSAEDATTLHGDTTGPAGGLIAAHNNAATPGPAGWTARTDVTLAGGVTLGTGGLGKMAHRLVKGDLIWWFDFFAGSSGYSGTATEFSWDLPGGSIDYSIPTQPTGAAFFICGRGYWYDSTAGLSIPVRAATRDATDLEVVILPDHVSYNQTSIQCAEFGNADYVTIIGRTPMDA